MTLQTYTNDGSRAVQAATDACFWFSLCDREKGMRPGSRKEECAIAAVEAAVRGVATYGEAWGDLVLTLQEKYPDHDFSKGYAAQAVWLSQAVSL